MLSLGLVASAQSFSFAYSQALPGGNLDLSVLFIASPSAPIYSTQFDLVMPSGFSVLSARRGLELPPEMQLANAGVRCIVYDLSAIHPVDSGEVVIYTLKAPTAVGNYTFSLTNLLASNASGMAAVSSTSETGQVGVKTTLTMPSVPAGIIARVLP